MNLRRVVGVCCLSLVLTTGVALADYQPANDLTLSATAAPTVLTPSSWTGDTSFALQEGAHSLVTNTTGQSVNHSYVWVSINGTKVLAVDPVWIDLN